MPNRAYDLLRHFARGPALTGYFQSDLEKSLRRTVKRFAKWLVSGFLSGPHVLVETLYRPGISTLRTDVTLGIARI
jgi:hypothetical protein